MRVSGDFCDRGLGLLRPFAIVHYQIDISCSAIWGPLLLGAVVHYTYWLAISWRRFCCNPGLEKSPVAKLKHKASICRKHFELHHFQTNKCLKINRNAIPSLFPPLYFSFTPTEIQPSQCSKSQIVHHNWNGADSNISKIDSIKDISSFSNDSIPVGLNKKSVPPLLSDTQPNISCMTSSLNSSITSSHFISESCIKRVKLRAARKEDCKEIHRLIQELAEYNDMPFGPKIDNKVLEEDGFGSDHPFFGCYVIEEMDEGEEKGKLIAYAAYFLGYSMWSGKSMYVKEIYVSQKYRGVGLGSKLIGTVVKKGLELGCKQMDFSLMKWNPAMDFCKEKGAIDITKMGGWHHFVLDHNAMVKLVEASAVSSDS